MANDNSILTIKSFLDNNSGLQRPNRYSVTFSNLPQAIKNFAGEQSTTVKMFSNAVAFGARTTDVTYDALSGYAFGRAVPKSTRYVGGVVLTVPVTGNQWVLKMMNAWFDYLYGNTNNQASSNNFIVPYYDQAVRPVRMKVSLLDLNGNPVPNGSYIFTEVYPIEAMPLELSMANVDKFLTYQVSFNFRKYYLE